MLPKTLKKLYAAAMQLMPLKTAPQRHRSSIKQIRMKLRVFQQSVISSVQLSALSTVMITQLLPLSLQATFRL